MTAQARDLLGADRLRAVLDPLVAAGHLVVVQAPGIDTAEGEAIVGAADLGLVVVELGRSRPRNLVSVAHRVRRGRTTLTAIVVGRRSRLRRTAVSRFGGHRPGPPAEGHGAGHAVDEGPTQEQSVSVIR
jgi:hypothetical protein